MSVGISVTSVTATSANITLSGKAGTRTELQLSTRPDFSRSASPRFDSAAGTTMTLSGLNAGTTYYARGRNWTSATVNDGWGAVTPIRTSAGAAWADDTGNIIVDKAILARPLPFLAVTANGAVAGHPAVNVGVPSPVAWWNLNTGGSHAITIQIGGDPIDTIALLNTNLPESSSITVKAGSTAAIAEGSSPAFTFTAAAGRASPNLPSRPGYHSLIRLAAPQAYQFWRIVITATVPGNVFACDHIVLGLNQATRAHAVDRKETPVDLGQYKRLRSGVLDRQPGLIMRRQEFELAMLTQDEFQKNYSELWREQSSMMLAVPNGKAGPYIHDRIAYGDFAGGGTSQPYSNRYVRPFTIDSLI
jgi:hypothetical protein